MIGLIVLLLAACAPGEPSTPAPTPDALALVRQAADNIRSAETFRLYVEQSGPDYVIETLYGGVLFRRAVGQYVAPGQMQAEIRVSAAGLNVNVDVFSRGEEQWYRAIWTGNQWLREDFSPGFNPEQLIAEDTGFRAALNALLDLDYLGIETLENGATVHHISGLADGAAVSALLVGLIETAGDVRVDVYIDTTTLYPVRFTLLETVPVVADGGLPNLNSRLAPGAPAERLWTVDISDINAAPALDGPEA